MRLSVASAAICLLTVGLSIADESRASIKRATSIPPEPLGLALQTLAKERGYQVVYESVEINPLRTQGASGDLTFEEALTRLLAGTALTYKFYDDNAVSIFPVGSASSTQDRAKSGEAVKETQIQQGDQKSFWERFRLARMDQGGSAESLSVDSSQSQKSANTPAYLEEVIVTAEKRPEALQAVPVSVSVLDADSMTQQHIMHVSDYLGSVPGLAADVSDQGSLSLAIRGITTGHGSGNPTVGVTIDDVPIGASAGLASGFVPELDPAVLKNIEVLRGPQGTLYGAASMGGLLRYVTAPPELSATHGRLEIDGLSVSDGGNGYGARAQVTAPVIADQVGVTANAFYRRDPGYVSNSTTGADNVNSENNAGARLAVLWQMADYASLQLAALYQRLEGHGSSIVEVDDALHPINGFNHNQIPGAGPFDRDFQLYSANLKVALGWGTLTSVTGYEIDTHHTASDQTAALGGLTSYATGRSDLGTLSLSMTDTRKLSEEVRLESSPTENLSLLGGLFYTRELSTVAANIMGSDLATGELVANVLPDFVPENNYTEYAAFADATYKFNDRVDVQAGARYAGNVQEYHEIINAGLLYAPPNDPYDSWAHSRDHAITYLFTPRWRISQNLMSYLRVASGYRPGGPNPGAGIGFPATFNSDTLTSYEVGVKGGGLLDGRLTFGADVYRINWNRIQLQETDPATDMLFYTNAGKAKSQGIELELSAAPVKGLVISQTLGYTDATLSQPLVAGLIGVSGDRLPYSARLTASLDIQQTVQLTNSASVFVGGNLRYVGDRPSDFSSSADVPRLDLPAYTLLDLRAGAVIDDWNISLFAQNVTNRFALLGASPELSGTDTGVNYALVQRPRTIGLSVTRSL